MKQLILFIRPLGRYLLVIWVLAIIFISSVPNLPSPKIHPGGFKIRLDYLFHFIEYGVLAFLTFLSFVKKDFSIAPKKYLVITLALMLFALADEYHQILIPGRTFNLKDILSNISGIVAAAVFCYFMFRSIKKDKILAP
jgi:VanZ family protein